MQTRRPSLFARGSSNQRVSPPALMTFSAPAATYTRGQRTLAKFKALTKNQSTQWSELTKKEEIAAVMKSLE